MKPFEIDSVTVCEYASRDIEGKAILVGGYAAEIIFSSPPPTWPQFRFVIVMWPLLKEFDFKIIFRRPDKKPLLSATGKYKLDRKPDPYERVNFNLQLAPVRFTGAGHYELEITDGEDNMLYSRPINIIVGEKKQRSNPAVLLEMKVDAEL